MREMTFDNFGGQINGISMQEAMKLAPTRMTGIDVEMFKLDELSLKIIELVNGQRTIGDIVEQTKEESEKVLAWLKMLQDGGIVHAFPVNQSVRAAEARLPASDIAADSSEAGEADSPVPPISAAEEKVEKVPGRRWEVETTGSLDENPADGIFAAAVQSAFTGSIHLSRKGENCVFHFEKGQAMGAQSSAERHDIGTMLWQDGRITVRMLENYRAALKQGAKTSVEALRKSGIDDRKVMAKMVSWWGGKLIKEVFDWSEGSYTVKPNDPFPPLVVRCRFAVPGVSGSVWRKIALMPEDEEFLEKNRPLYVVPGPRADMIVMKMGLDGKEMRYVDALFAEPMQLSRGMAISPLYRSATKRILFYLLQSGAILLCDTNPDGVSPIDLDELEPFLRRFKTIDHFSVLTAHATSTQEEILERYQKRLAEFDPSRFSSEANEHHLELISQIRARIEEAYSVLKDPESRRKYRESRYDIQQLRSFFELQLRKAEIAMRMRMDPKGALLLGRSALEIKPNSSEAKLVLAEAYFMLGELREARLNIRGVAAVPEHLQAVFKDLKMRIG